MKDKIGSAKAYNAVASDINVNILTGECSTCLFFLENTKDLNELLDHCDLRLTEGNLPKEGENEIIVHKAIMKNKSYKLGDKFENYKITGIISGETEVSLGFMKPQMKELYQSMYPTFILPVNGDNQNRICSELSSLKDKEWSGKNYKSELKNHNSFYDSLNSILLFAIILITCCIAAAMSELTGTIYGERYSEFAILNDLGYRRRIISRLIITEITGIFIFAWLIGYGGSLLLNTCLDKAIFADMGQSLPIIYVPTLAYSLIIPIISTIAVLIPVTYKLKKPT